ncbi:MAG TPA: hypothetical protein VNF46_01560 [Gammaproteobacteria bacterium]|nr:hypothetical protein [Gammaproteobacteria bacterium]
MCGIRCHTAQFDLLKDMSVADYRATGLDHLSDAQIKVLSIWFANYQRQHAKSCGQAAAAVSAAAVAPVAAASAVPAPASSHPKLSGDVIVASSISRTFSGWSGGTLFKLDNGQTWGQTDDNLLTIAAIAHPRVTITKGAFNAYYLYVEGVTDSVQVRRVEP